MKLIVCSDCAGVISLGRQAKSCPCGSSQAAYLDNRNAIYSGPCVPLGFDNNEFVEAVGRGQGLFNAFVIPATSRYFRRVDDKPK